MSQSVLRIPTPGPTTSMCEPKFEKAARLILLIRGSDRDNVGIGGRERRLARIVVAHRSDHEGAPGDGVSDGVALHKRVGVAAEAEIEDARAVVHRPADASRDVDGRTAAGHPSVGCPHHAGEDPHRHDPAPGRNPSHPDGVVPGRGDRASDVRAVADLVVRHGISADEVTLVARTGRRCHACEVHEVVPGDEVRVQIRVVEVSAGIDHRHDHGLRA